MKSLYTSMTFLWGKILKIEFKWEKKWKYTIDKVREFGPMKRHKIDNSPAR